MGRYKERGLTLESAVRIVEQALVCKVLKGQSKDPRLDEALSRLGGLRRGQIKALENLSGVTVKDLREERRLKRMRDLGSRV